MSSKKLIVGKREFIINNIWWLLCLSRESQSSLYLYSTDCYDEMNQDFHEEDLPEDLRKAKPVEPLPAQCCGSGCSFCVYDIFEQELKIWRKECLHYFNKCDDEGKTGPALSPDFYSKFKLASITQETKDCRVYRFTVPESKMFCLKLGQHLILRGTVDGQYVSRQYTPISPQGTKDYFDVIIKIYNNGMMSQYVSQLKPNMDVEWRGPFGGVIYKPNSVRTVFLIAAGTGIAPMIPLLHSIVEDEDDETFLRLLFSCRTYDDILLKKTLNYFKGFWNFTLRYYLSQEPDVARNHYGEDIYYGHIDKSVLLNEINSKQKCKVFVCGSVSFNDDIKNCLRDILKEDDYFIFQ